MSQPDVLCHTSSTVVAAPADQAFAFMADGIKQGRWAFGSWDRRAAGEDGLFIGTSLFSGEETFVRIDADPEKRLIDYAVGSAPDALSPRIMARIIPGPALGRAPSESVISLIIWRTADMSDERWQQVCVTHETEMYIIRHLVESGA